MRDSQSRDTDVGKIIAAAKGGFMSEKSGGFYSVIFLNNGQIQNDNI